VSADATVGCWYQRVVGREQGKGRFKPMFVQFVLENLWAVYDAAMLRPYVSLALHGLKRVFMF